jgi:hypothetical protein
VEQPFSVLEEFVLEQRLIIHIPNHNTHPIRVASIYTATIRVDTHKSYDRIYFFFSTNCPFFNRLDLLSTNLAS